MNDLENQIGTLLIENERLDKMNKDLSDICKTTEKAFADKQHQLMQQLQDANFEKNRFKEAIESDGNFEQLREVVNKV
jgi:hypothetical protein